MDDSKPEKGSELTSSHASKMLQDVQRIDGAAQRISATNTQRRITLCKPVVLFVFVTAFLWLFTAPSPAGTAYVPILLIPLLCYTMLIQGAHNSQAVAPSIVLQGRKLVFMLLGILPFLVLMALSLWGLAIPWWACVLAGLCAVTPSGLQALRTHRSPPAAGSQTRVAAKPLSRPATAVTIGVGLFHGFAGICLVFPWFLLAAFLLSLCLIAATLFANARAGLTSVGSEWATAQWVSFGLAYLGLVVLTLVVVLTPWGTPSLGVIGGLLIALPLVISALWGRTKS